VNAGATLNLTSLTLVNGLGNFVGGGVDNEGTLTVTNCTFSNNDGFDGGAIYNDGMLTVTKSTFSNNQSTVEGGAILNNGTVNVTSGTFSGNHAPGSGGAIENNAGGTSTVTNSTFTGNQTAGFGGAIENFKATLTVTNSTFSDNNAIDIGGGAIASDGPLTVINSTFSGNQSTGNPTARGGAIFSDLEPTVTNSTFSGNQATGGGGAIYNNPASTGLISLKGNILADSTSGNCGGTAVIDAGHNISDDGSCGFSGTSINHSTTLHLDPLGLQNNGGPTLTIALEPNSEAVDFIPVADCTDQSSPTPVALTTDQRGFPRPDPGNPNFCDAGAFELQTMPFVLAPKSERVQIARSTTPDSDQVNMAFTFTENGFPACDAADNAFNGFDVDLLAGTCETHDHTGLFLSLDSWVVHTVNHQIYGTLFQSLSPGTVSARMVQLPTPAAPACGEWSVNIEVVGIDSSDLGNGPFSLVLSNPDADTGCFDITNAIVGSQTPSPPHGVRRGCGGSNCAGYCGREATRSSSVTSTTPPSSSR